MPGLFVLTLVFTLGSNSITSSTPSDFKYNWDACQQAGEAVKRQNTRADFVCVPVLNTIINNPQPQRSRDQFFPVR